MGTQASTSPNTDDWVRLTQPHTVEGKERYYGRLFELAGDGSMLLAFPIRKTYKGPSQDQESYDFCSFPPANVETVDQGHGPVRIGGSSGGQSGSLQSGGNHSYCTCDGCF